MTNEIVSRETLEEKEQHMKIEFRLRTYTYEEVIDKILEIIEEKCSELRQVETIISSVENSLSYLKKDIVALKTMKIESDEEERKKNKI